MTWLGRFAPKGTPAPVVVRLNAEVRAVLPEESVQARVAKLGGAVSLKTVPAFDAMIRKNNALSSKLVTDANLKAEWDAASPRHFILRGFSWMPAKKIYRTIIFFQCSHSWCG